MKKNKMNMKMISICIVLILMLTIFSVSNVNSKLNTSDCIDPDFGVKYRILVGDCAFIMWGDEGLPDNVLGGGFSNEFKEAMSEYPNGIPPSELISKAKWVFYSFAIPLDTRDIHPVGNQNYSVSLTDDVELPDTAFDDSSEEGMLRLKDINVFNFNTSVIDKLNINGGQPNNLPSDLYINKDYILPIDLKDKLNRDYLPNNDNNILPSIKRDDSFTEGTNYYAYTEEVGVSYKNKPLSYKLVRSFPDIVFGNRGWEENERVTDGGKRVEGHIEIFPTSDQRLKIRQMVRESWDQGKKCTGCIVVFPDTDIFEMTLDTVNYPFENQPHHPLCDIDYDHIANGRDIDMDGDYINNNKDDDMDGDGILDTEDTHIDRSPFCDFYVLSLRFKILPSFVLWDYAEYQFPLAMKGEYPDNDDDDDTGDDDDDDTGDDDDDDTGDDDDDDTNIRIAQKSSFLKILFGNSYRLLKNIFRNRLIKRGFW